MKDLNVGDREDALLRAVRAVPEHDAPRERYADSLTERGDPRGEFIRLQLERARALGDASLVAEPTRRERALLRDHRKWRAAAGQPTKRFPAACYHRGFVEDQSLNNGYWQKFDMAAFAASPEVALMRLYLYENDEGPGLATIHAARLLAPLTAATLRRLDLEDVTLIGNSFELLVAAPGAAGLTSLAADCCHVGNDGAVALATVASSQSLERLVLNGNGIGLEGLQALVDLPRFQRLESLDLHGNRIGDEGVALLAASPNLPALRDLRLGMNQLTDDAAHALAESPHLARIERLGVDANLIGPAAMAALRERFGESALEPPTPTRMTRRRRSST